MTLISLCSLQPVILGWLWHLCWKVFTKKKLDTSHIFSKMNVFGLLFFFISVNVLSMGPLMSSTFRIIHLLVLKWDFVLCSKSFQLCHPKWSSAAGSLNESLTAVNEVTEEAAVSWIQLITEAAAVKYKWWLQDDCWTVSVILCVRLTMK